MSYHSLKIADLTTITILFIDVLRCLLPDNYHIIHPVSINSYIQNIALKLFFNEKHSFDLDR